MCVLTLESEILVVTCLSGPAPVKLLCGYGITGSGFQWIFPQPRQICIPWLWRAIALFAGSCRCHAVCGREEFVQ